MRFTRTGTAILAGAVFAAVSLAAAPAYAAEAPSLPPGYSMYAISCAHTGPVLFALDTATAAATAVDAATSGTGCGGQAAWDPTTGVAFYLNWTDHHLYSADVATGATTDIGDFTAAGQTMEPQAIAIGTNGAAYAFSDTETGDGMLYSLDLTTAAVTPIGTTGGQEHYEAFSVDPSTGAFYAIDFDGNMASVDTTTGAFTPLGTAVPYDPGFFVPATLTLSIDANGIWWVDAAALDVPSNSFHSSLWSFDPARQLTTAVYSGDIATDPADPATGFDMRSIFVAPTGGVAPVVTPAVVTPAAPVPVAEVVKPMLAETGVDSAQVGTLGLSAIAALLLGAGLFTAGRSRSKARA